MRPMRRCGTGIATDDSAGREMRRCEVGCMLCAGAGAAPFVPAAPTEPGAGVASGLLGGGRLTLGASGYDCGGAAAATFCWPLDCRCGGRDCGSMLGVRWPTRCAGCCTGWAPVSIFCVGARRFSPAARRAPQPPQNRESGSLSVPQTVQRILSKGNSACRNSL
jgi:hypothetical protein